nr:MAG TPA: hypothetical protein [Caudoviricetes sp.]DAM73201.1 MAG TPA: hypothetical protein [Caudoviricetes sp.]DAN68998.1 MAG TPA: hypothetical protein [Caudoviricetes sp.]
MIAFSKLIFLIGVLPVTHLLIVVSPIPVAFEIL